GEASRARRGPEAAHEVGDRVVVEDEREQLALEATGDAAPVAPDRLEPDDLQLFAHESRVALLAPGRAAPHLGHEEARVDLLELELQVARAGELARQRRPDRLADRDPEPLAAA